MSELEKTIDLLEEMDDEQLQAIQTVAKILVFRKPKDNADNTSSDSGKESAMRKGKRRTAGLYRGQVYIADDFDAPLSDEMEYIHGAEKLLPRVSAVETCPDYRLLLTFRNGEQRIFDASSLLDLPAYKKVRDVFSSARVEFGTVIWPGDVDISPDTLYLQSVPVECAREA